MGTPAFAVGPLRALLMAGYPVVGVMTQPDRPVGRAQTLTAPPVKQLALDHGIPVHQPGRLRREPEALEILKSWNPDLVVVVAFGQILPRDVLEVPPRGCLNVHGSILPAYRGAAPIQWAIANGEAETGVAIMLMNEGLDTGPVLSVTRTPIGPSETGQDLADRLSILGSQLLVETIPGWMDGSILAKAQDDRAATLAPILRREDAVIDWNRSARSIHDRIRAFQPWPGATLQLGDLVVKVLQTTVLDIHNDQEPGTLTSVTPEGWIVATGNGETLRIDQVQIPGKKPQPATEASRGLRQLAVGFRFG